MRSKSKSYALEGQLPPGPRLAVVGSRAAHRRDRPDVEALVGMAKARGYALVSGGALGVDAWMHRAALEQDVPQLVVLPCALGHCYPPDHHQLFADILATGHSGLVYSVPDPGAMARYVFVARNLIVVRACQALVIVQAQRRSGSIWTGKKALAAGKRVAVFAGTPGTQLLADKGARCLGASHEPERCGRIKAWLDGREDPRQLHWPEHLRPLRAALMQHKGRTCSLDEMHDPLLAALWVQEARLLGLVREVGPGRYALAREDGS